MSNDQQNMPGQNKSPGILVAVRESVRRLDGARFRGFLIYLCVLVAVFSGPLLAFAGNAVQGSLYSHVFLIPVISIYLIALRAPSLPTNLQSA